MGLVGLPSGSYYHRDDPGEPIVGSPRLSITDVEGTILAKICEGKTVLEIGTGLAISTIYMLSTAKWVFTYDIDDWVRANIWPTLAQFANVGLLYDVPENLGVDIVFLDACHNTEAVKKDIDTYVKNIVPGGYLVLHDVSYPNVAAAIAEKGLKDKMQWYKTAHGIGVIKCG